MFYVLSFVQAILITMCLGVVLFFFLGGGLSWRCLETIFFRIDHIQKHSESIQKLTKIQFYNITNIHIILHNFIFSLGDSLKVGCV